MDTLKHQRYEYYLQKRNSSVAIKIFTDILNSALEHYQKLWDDYLHLLKDCSKTCVDTQKNKEQQLNENENRNDKNLNEKKQTETNSNSLFQEKTEIFLPNSKFLNNLCQQNDGCNLLSPVLSNHHRSSDKSISSSESDIQHNSSKSSKNASVCDTSVSADKQEKKEDKEIAVKPVDDLNCSEIDNTIVNHDHERPSVLTDKYKNCVKKKSNSLSLPKKTGLLSISKLYKADLEISSNCKKLKQTTLVLNPPKENVHINTSCKLDDSLNRAGVLENCNSKNESVVSSTPQKSNLILNEDVVDNSPCRKNHSKKRRLVLKKECKKVDKDLKVLKSNVDNDKSEGKKDKEFCVESLLSLNKHHKDSPVDKELEKNEAEELVKEIKKEVISDVKPITNNKRNRICDETNFTLVNQSKENNKNIPINLNIVKTECSMSAAEKTSINEFAAPWANRSIDDKSKKKNERQQLNGWSCWQCKKYYECLGLSDEELRYHKNQCSKHRSKYKELPLTPASFWAVAFPETAPSFQDK